MLLPGLLWCLPGPKYSCSPLSRTAFVRSVPLEPGVTYRAGKKYNVLRGRVDTLDSDMEQLLLGTLVFAILVLLLPTAAVYYIFFRIVQGVAAALVRVLSVVVRTVNRSALYAVATVLLDPTQIPSGVRFTVDASASEEGAVTSTAEEPSETRRPAGRGRPGLPESRSSGSLARAPETSYMRLHGVYGSVGDLTGNEARTRCSGRGSRV